ncbi:hypothetical protein [Glycomyces tenuis]|nr:hypothetical protein [Glycomyces tenuis]
MTLFQLQAWLGHRSPQSPQFYAKLTPAPLTQAYEDAGYFERNLRTIEVLIDREAADGEPWQHYDLGHGYCRYAFFEQCPHRTACARCDFHIPKDAAKTHLREAKDHLQQMRTAIPLTRRRAGRRRRRTASPRPAPRTPRRYSNPTRAHATRTRDQGVKDDTANRRHQVDRYPTDGSGPRAGQGNQN